MSLICAKYLNGFHKYLNYANSVSRESIIDVEAKVVSVPNKIESCTEQTIELCIEQLFVVSQAKPQLPLQIEDASRPENPDVCINKSLSFMCGH